MFLNKFKILERSFEKNLSQAKLSGALLEGAVMPDGSKYNYPQGEG